MPQRNMKLILTILLLSSPAGTVAGRSPGLRALQRDPIYQQAYWCADTGEICKVDSDCNVCSGGGLDGLPCSDDGNSDGNVASYCPPLSECTGGGFNVEQTCSRAADCQVGTCNGGSNDGLQCLDSADCGGLCSGGANDGNECFDFATLTDCPPAGMCENGDRDGLPCTQDDEDAATGCPDKTNGNPALRIGTCVMDAPACVPGACEGAMDGVCSEVETGVCEFAAAGTCGEDPPYTDLCDEEGCDILREDGLGQCEGDCDDDADCVTGLVCYQRGTNTVESVPGCSGVPTSSEDYCGNRTAYPNHLWYATDNPGRGELLLCEGDCDKDRDCYGDLECFVRGEDGVDPDKPVPGCDGAGRPGTDYCYVP